MTKITYHASLNPNKEVLRNIVGHWEVPRSHWKIILCILWIMNIQILSPSNKIMDNYKILHHRRLWSKFSSYEILIYLIFIMLDLNDVQLYRLNGAKLSVPPSNDSQNTYLNIIILYSCVNPILYAFLSDNFRKAFRQWLPRSLFCFKDGQRGSSSLRYEHTTIRLSTRPKRLSHVISKKKAKGKLSK